MRLTTATACMALLSCCSCRPSSSPSQHERQLFHTTPDKWSEPRIFHTPFDEQWADRMDIDTVPVGEVGGEKMFSPNKAYWFVASMSDTTQPGPHSGAVHIYNERDHLIRIQLPDIKSGGLKANWINEKLLHMRVWLGRVLGIDAIFDVETEQFAYREMANWGEIAYQQWQQAKEMQQQ